MPKGMQPIYSAIYTATASSISFNNIPQNYSDLVMKVSGRSTAVDTGNIIQFVMYVNNEGYPALTHSFTYLESNANTTYSGRETGTFIRLGYMPAAGATASVFGNIETYIPNYSTSLPKQIISDYSSENNNANTAEALKIGTISGYARQYVPITSIGLDSGRSQIAGTTVTLYGISRQ
jgi:hypothetical protein